MGRPDSDPQGSQPTGSEPQRRDSPWRHVLRAFAALVLASGVCFLALLASHHPRDLPLSWRCPFFTLTHLRCPGCGLTRATHHVFQGELWAAAQLNPLIFVAPLIIAWVVYVLGVMVVRGRIPHMPAPPTAVGWAIFALLMAFWLYRIIVDLL